ncbi:exosortase-associated protein EpsI, B-type [Aquabacterium sp.]|uniref:exosortase-associated protein EpsI, B-type n=1 Tax=Aquabacterium sp. TaxID=1872578 RepID=UPI0035AF8F90
MTTSKTIGWALCALMTAASAVAYKLTPHQLLADTLPALVLEKDFPDNVGNWKTDPKVNLSIPNPDTESVIKSIYTDTLSRVYINAAGKQVFLSVAYGKNQAEGHALHYPEVCYPAQGYVITSKQVAPIQLGGVSVPAKHLVAARGAEIEPITYWATVGQKIILNGTQHKMAQVGYGFKGFLADGLIIRVSTIGASPAAEYEVQREFLESLMQSIRPEVRSRVMGDLAFDAK